MFINHVKIRVYKVHLRAYKTMKRMLRNKRTFAIHMQERPKFSNFLQNKEKNGVGIKRERHLYHTA